MSSTLLIMIDGVAADYVASYPARTPNLRALAEEGLHVERLAADEPATSLPGRTSILTGVGADRHGIYGNVIADADGFRYANPDDVRVPTLPRRAREAGRDVAVVGYGMVRPEDADVFHHAWWANEMLQRARDLEPIPADEGWLRTSRHRDPSGRLAALAEAGLPETVPDAYAGGRLHYLLSEMTGDQTMMRWAAGLATSDAPPDLIVTEILGPDSVQHASGYASAFAHTAIGYADALVGTLVAELDRAGRLEETTLVITSDHGHGPVDRALYADAILPGREVSTEGGFLYVRTDGPGDAAEVEARLAERGAERLAGDHLPPDARERIAAFAAPPGTVFETRPPEAGLLEGAPRNPSSHGFRPGDPADERFLVARGPRVPRARIDRAASDAVEATLAALLGLEPHGTGTPLVGE